MSLFTDARCFAGVNIAARLVGQPILGEAKSWKMRGKNTCGAAQIIQRVRKAASGATRSTNREGCETRHNLTIATNQADRTPMRYRPSARFAKTSR